MTVSPLRAPSGTAARHPFTSRAKCALGATLTTLAVVLAAAAPASGEPVSVVFKRQQADRVLGQIQSLDASLEHAIDAYNAANERLSAIQADLRQNQRELVLARKNLKRARQLLARRLVALYTSGGQGSTLDVVLGSQSLADAIDGVDAANRVSEQDTRVLRAVRRYRHVVRTRRIALKRAERVQGELVRERAARKGSIEQQLAQRQQLLSSIRDEIEQMKAAEARRQAELAAQARARMAQEQAAPQIVPSPVAPIPAEQSPPAEVAPPVAAPARYGGVVGIAMRYLGTPYVYGGASPSGFDCSGFVMYVYAQVGVSLPHNAAAQYGYGTPVSRSDLQPGDLVFFNGLGHDGIYIGGNQFIHSPHTGDVVKISSISGWYASTWVGARRL